jgi:hypothetical protein
MEGDMLQRGDLVPHFEVMTLEAGRVNYSTIWQRRNLVLLAVPSSDPDGTFRRYAGQVAAEGRAFRHDDTEWVITSDVVPGIPSPGVIVADRWGEILLIASGSRVVDLPDPHEVAGWVTYLHHQCPECEGEAR